MHDLKNLNDKAYDSRVEEELNKNLTKAENTAACLGQVTCYLTQVGYEKWEDHQKEVNDMDKEVENLWKEISAKAHMRNQAARRNSLLAAASGPAREQDNSGTMKLVADLKPDLLSQDATAGELRIWVKKFAAYYHASNMQVARIAGVVCWMVESSCSAKALSKQFRRYACCTWILVTCILEA